MSEQQAAFPLTEAPPSNVTESPTDHTPPGDRGSPTMSPEEQGAFETAEQQMTLQPREKGKARQMMNSNLASRVTRENTSVHAGHFGGYANVFVGWFRDDDGTRTRVAIKVLQLVNEPDLIREIKTNLIREVTVWIDLDHPNILKFLGA
ncbi:hypothetical protein P691DRAFT_823239 [Macrolepiota fuliginosa MF-IS2]|uniref:Protein kinase domain-containing protein n=1 Tax=Macrolepiota fuliginosa MF-IS2 TaxID=1400762 RepID=A0A9P5WXP7_9AGAR|nr:hypothetical protein P691DRAFT_823239 [Macrolepiota fuliginosa MF-IS2]